MSFPGRPEPDGRASDGPTGGDRTVSDEVGRTDFIARFPVSRAGSETTRLCGVRPRAKSGSRFATAYLLRETGPCG